MGLSFLSDTSAPYGEHLCHTPLIASVLAPNPSAFTYTGTQTFLIGRKNLWILDPGPDDEIHLKSILKAIAGRTLKGILITHTHRDHSGLADKLKKATGTLVGAYAPHGLGQPADMKDEQVEEGADTNFKPDFLLKDGDVLEEDCTLKVLHTPGHTSNHLCFHLQEENVLFTGDTVMGWSTSIVSPPDGDMAAYMQSLEKIKKIKASLLKPTHGPAIPNPEDFINDLIEHRKGREEKILTAVQKQKSTLPDIVADAYQDTPAFLHPAAMRSALAHLIWLEQKGMVKATPKPSLKAKFLTAV